MKDTVIDLKSGDWAAHVLPYYGADLIALSYKGEMVLRVPGSREEFAKNPFLYGSPLLFPPNRTENGEFSFEGRIYQLPVNEKERRNHLHGMMFHAPFSVEKAGKEELVCSYQNKGERYPFPFTATFRYRVAATGLKVEVSIKNDGSVRMPAVIGFHTTFVKPELFTAPIERRWERDDRLLPTGVLLPLNQMEQEIKSGCRIGVRKLAGYYTSSGHEVRLDQFVMRTSEEFCQWVLFNGEGSEGYLCVEPQTGPVNGLNLPGGFVVIDPGRTKKYWILFERA